MSLFDGTYSFTPAFTGRELAIRSGGQAAQSFTGGMNAGTSREHVQLAQDEFSFKKKQYDDQINRLSQFKQWLDSQIGGAEQNEPDAW